MKGSQHSIDMLPAKKTREEAESEIQRLEANRAENNARCDEADKTPHYRGKSFMFMRDNEPWWIKEIE